MNFDSETRIASEAAARELVVEDKDILGGTPVVRGTRVPVHDLAAARRAGESMARILETYPSLNERQVDLAVLYAQAVPAQDERHRLVPPPGSQVLSRRKHLRS